MGPRGRPPEGLTIESFDMSRPAASQPVPPDFRQHLEVETPEHVLLDLEIAGFGSRLVAALIDNLILGGLTLGSLILLAILERYRLIPGGTWTEAIVIFFLFALWNGYFIFFEGMRAGQTPGKRRAGLRVVQETGHAVTLGAAVARNLLRIADFLPPPYVTGVLLTALHPRGQRLGDMVAGTIVVRDRPWEIAAPRAAAAPQAEPLAAPVLTDAEFRLLAGFVARIGQLDARASGRITESLAARFAPHLRSGLAPHLRPGPGDSAEALVELHARELTRRQGRLAGRSAMGDRLATQQAHRWDEFHRLAERAARRGLDSFTPAELPDFAARYREVAADLARARTYRAEPATIGHLERLVAAGHNALYRDERMSWRSIWHTVSRDFPGAVLQQRRMVLLACLVFMGPALSGYALMRDRPALAAELLPEVMLRRAEAGRSRAKEGRKYVEVAWANRPAAASFIITNNVRIAMSCFAGGIFLGIGSLVLLAFNGLALGTFAGHFANQGLLGYLLEFIVGHGVLELFAIWVAGAAGFLLGRSIIAPGELSRGDALMVNGRIAVRMVGATVVLLTIAGMIEGFLSTAGGGLVGRVAAGLGSLVFLAVYLAHGRARGSETI